MSYMNWAASFLFVGFQIAPVQAHQGLHRSNNTDRYTNAGPVIDVWYGPYQKVGHLGSAQDDFNLLGSVSDPDGVALLTYRLNNSPSQTLTIGRGRFGDGRRLAADGDFNADIPIRRMKPGLNTIKLTATDSLDARTSATVQVDQQEGTYSLPAYINWSSVSDPQNVGQYVDGKWGLTNKGMRTLRTGYDRIFLIGNRTWQDYEVTVPITIHWVAPKTAPYSYGNGVGLLMRFQGYVVNPPRFPAGQPKWGYQPFGAIGWLRWEDGATEAPTRQFYRGDSNKTKNFGVIPIVIGKTYWMKMRAETLRDDSLGRGVTRYSWKFWAKGEAEPPGWGWQVVQRSREALRRGGVALLAHHVDATFGNVSVVPIPNTLSSKRYQGGD